ncbi:MAG: sugar MFS transporter [Paludibacter sp.]|nr:sugar MFS transporter [Paludibacter sp.]MDD4199011.1 sugar MFS transporter [Paludibacter sp.]MDD4427125.1 sugar MFS transporter [Paludibacter sp.]
MDNNQPQVINKRTYFFSIAILATLFFIFGLVSWVNTILIPYFKLTCELTIVQSYLVTFAFFIAYLVMAIPSSFLLNKVGYKRGIMFGLWFMALGALLFVPAAYWRTYEIFLIGLFMLGIGLAILQSAANPYVTIIGPRESAAKRLSIVGTGNKLAGIIANLVFAAVVIKESDKVLMQQIKEGVFSGAELETALDTLIRGVMTPYLILGIFLFIFGIIVRYSILPELDAKDVNKSTSGKVDIRTSIFQYPWLILGALAIFFHVGSQMISLATIIDYAGTMGLTLEGDAKNFPSFTMFFTFLGYLTGIVMIPKYLNQKNALLICSLLGLLFSLLTIFTTGKVNILGMETDISIWFLVLMGYSNALVYAGIWPLAIRDLGKYTNLGSSFLVMGLCGSAILPLIFSYVVDLNSALPLFDAYKVAYWVLVPCFLYLIFFATVGYKIEHWRKNKA